MSTPPQLPPGQMERQDFPRFGLGGFAFRFPTETDRIEITVRGDVACAITVGEELRDLPRVDSLGRGSWTIPGPGSRSRSEVVALPPVFFGGSIQPSFVPSFRFALGRHLARQESPRDSQP